MQMWQGLWFISCCPYPHQSQTQLKLKDQQIIQICYKKPNKSQPKSANFNPYERHKIPPSLNRTNVSCRLHPERYLRLLVEPSREGQSQIKAY